MSEEQKAPEVTTPSQEALEKARDERINACKQAILSALKHHACYIDVAVTINTSGAVTGQYIIKSK